MDLHVAVVGGGVGGAYAGWRLVTADPRSSGPLGACLDPGESLKVGLFELGDQVGGRLHSVKFPGLEHVPAEVGGMRYLDSQQLVARLVEELGLEPVPFPAGDNLYFLRGRRLTAADWPHPDRVPYFLEDGERGRTPEELFEQALLRLMPELARATPADHARLVRTTRYNGIPLHDQGLWDLLLQLCSVEAWNLMQDACGYYSRMANMNAADFILLYMSHYRTHEHFWKLADGFQALPLELARRFSQEGGSLHTRHRLRRIDPPTASDPRFRLLFHSGHGDRVCRAHHVVLALPRRSFELLEPDCFLFRHPQFLEDLGSVAPQRACKLWMAFERPWWEDLGIRAGRSDTDLPMRQCFYFGTEGDQPGADPANRRSLLKAGYNDGRAVDFWTGFTGSCPSRSGVVHQFGGAIREKDLVPPEAMVRESLRQLTLVHGMEVPRPYAALFRDWGDDPFGGAWHLWNIHARSWEVMPRMREPVPGLNLSVCGEAWSHQHGWVEGALCTAERVLQDRLGLPGPAFLPADYYLGD